MISWDCKEDAIKKNDARTWIISNVIEGLKKQKSTFEWIFNMAFSFDNNSIARKLKQITLSYEELKHLATWNFESSQTHLATPIPKDSIQKSYHGIFNKFFNLFNFTFLHSNLN